MRSIRCSARHEARVRRLAVGGIFPTMREVMSFAAVVGFSRGVTAELAEGAVEIVDARNVQSGTEAMEVMTMLGIAHREALDLVAPDREDELVECFERYAEGGLNYLDDILGDVPGDEEKRRVMETLVAEFGAGGEAHDGNPHDAEF